MKSVVKKSAARSAGQCAELSARTFCTFRASCRMSVQIVSRLQTPHFFVLVVRRATA